MDKRRSYIYERTYMEYQNRKREDEVESYWKDILGEDIIQHLKEKTYYQIYDNLSTDKYYCNITEDIKLSEIEELYLNILKYTENNNYKQFGDMLFYPFYDRLLECLSLIHISEPTRPY